MSMIFGLVALVGWLISVVFSILLLVRIFKVSGPLWGLGSIFVPFVSLVWLVMNWEEGKDPFLKSLGGVAIAVVGGVGAAMFGGGN